MKALNIYGRIERLSELLRVDSRLAGTKYGLQPIQLEVLHYLSICNRFSDTPMAVTEYLGQTKGSVSQTINVLENKGLLSKHDDKDDKRITHIKVTSKGKRLLDNLIPTPLFKKACQTLEKKEKVIIDDALGQLLETMLTVNNMKPFGVCKSCRYNTKNDNDGFFCNLVEQPLSKNEIQMICREFEHA